MFWEILYAFLQKPDPANQPKQQTNKQDHQYVMRVTLSEIFYEPWYLSLLVQFAPWEV